MLKKLAELADKKEQVNLSLAKSKDHYLFCLAPKGAGDDKLPPLLIKGTLDEIDKQLDEKLPAYIEACTKKPEPPKKEKKKAPAKKKASSKKKVADKKPEEPKEPESKKESPQLEFDLSF